MGARLGCHLPRLHLFNDGLGEFGGNHAMAAHRRDLQNLISGKERLLPVDAEGEESGVRLEIEFPGNFDDLIDQAADDDRDSRIRLPDLLQD